MSSSTAQTVVGKRQKSIDPDFHMALYHHRGLTLLQRRQQRKIGNDQNQSPIPPMGKLIITLKLHIPTQRGCVCIKTRQLTVLLAFCCRWRVARIVGWLAAPLRLRFTQLMPIRQQSTAPDNPTDPRRKAGRRIAWRIKRQPRRKRLTVTLRLLSVYKVIQRSGVTVQVRVAMAGLRHRLVSKPFDGVGGCVLLTRGDIWRWSSENWLARIAPEDPIASVRKGVCVQVAWWVWGRAQGIDDPDDRPIRAERERLSQSSVVLARMAAHGSTN